MRTEITRESEQAALGAIVTKFFPAGKTKLVQDDTVTPAIDEITPYTDAIAAHASAINPKKGYPGQSK